MLTILFLLTAPVWGRLFGYKRKVRQVSRNRQAPPTETDWDNIPWVHQ